MEKKKPETLKSLLDAIEKYDPKWTRRAIAKRMKGSEPYISALLRQEREGERVSPNYIQRIKAAFALELYGTKVVDTSVEEELGKLREEVIRHEAMNGVLLRQVAELLAINRGSSTAKAYQELKEAADKDARQMLSEL